MKILNRVLGIFGKKVHISIPKESSERPILVVGKHIKLTVIDSRPEAMYLEVNRGCEDNVKLIGFTKRKARKKKGKNINEK